MIIFAGIKYVNKQPMLSFTNDQGKLIDVPVDIVTADRVQKYLSKISAPAEKKEPGNDLDSE